MRSTTIGLVAGLVLATVPAAAHHEAIFGPQSSLLLSQRGFVSLQGFSKRAGPPEARLQETTLLLSGGGSPFERLPLSFAATLPGAIEAPATGHGHAGLEDLMLGVRYRLDLAGLQRVTGKEGNFVLALAAIELPTGTLHAEPFDRPPNYLSGLLASLERGAFSAMAFGFGTLRSAGQGNELFTGGGLAWTPVDGERLLSLQVGATYEHLFRDGAGGQVVLTPTVVFAPGGHWQLFAMAALPVVQGRTDPLERDLWRVGGGVIYAFAHDH
jgi:hypothetical protein